MVEQPVCESTEMERLVDVYGTGMLRMCCMYLGDVHLAQDAVQDAFIKIYRAWRPIENPSAEKAWVMRITVNVCKDYLRSAWKRKVNLVEQYPELPGTETQGRAGPPVPGDHGPETQIQRGHPAALLPAAEGQRDRRGAGRAPVHGEHPAAPRPGGIEKKIGGRAK